MPTFRSLLLPPLWHQAAAAALAQVRTPDEVRGVFSALQREQDAEQEIGQEIGLEATAPEPTTPSVQSADPAIAAVAGALTNAVAQLTAEHLAALRTQLLAALDADDDAPQSSPRSWPSESYPHGQGQE